MIKNRLCIEDLTFPGQGGYRPSFPLLKNQKSVKYYERQQQFINIPPLYSVIRKEIEDPFTETKCDYRTILLYKNTK